MNMAHCRFHNTTVDLRDCAIALADLDDHMALSEEESRAKDRLLILCKRIADDYEDEIEEILRRKEEKRQSRMAEAKTK